MIRLMTYNILDGGAGRIDPLAEVIRHVRPDVVACLEADRREDFELLARRLDMHSHWAEPVEKHAVGVLSARPILHAANHGRTPMQRTCAELRVATGAGELTLFAVHLRPGIGIDREQERLEELDCLLSLTAPARRGGRPHVLLGDFNASHPEQRLEPSHMRERDRRTVDEQGGQAPRQVIARLLETGYVDAYDMLHGSRDGCTLSTREPSLRVDYIFLWPDLAGRLRACQVHQERLARYASDHYPLWADLDL